MTAIEFDDVSKVFGATRALTNVSFRVRSGDKVGLLGPNGSGKTTALRLILNLFEPQSGCIRVLGQAPSHHVNERVGYLPEERGLYRDMKVADLLVYYARLKGVHLAERRLDEWLNRLRIYEYKQQKVRGLSKGTSQKVQFLTAVLHDPPLVILDEPFSGLDPLSRKHLREAIDELSAAGKTLIFSTHDVAAAESSCDAFVMLHRGRKVLDLSRSDLHDKTNTRVLKLTTDRPLGEEPLSGVERRLRRGHDSELTLAPGADPQRVLRELSGQYSINRFEVTRPSLEELFLQIAEAAPSSAETPSNPRTATFT